MEGQKRAWIYCAIDAPEDSRNTLKDQRQQLMDYAEQMGFEIAGSASDTGRQPFWERSGFCEFIESAKNDRTDILLLASLHCIGHTAMQLAQFQAMAGSLGIEVYSPMTGAMQFCQ